MKAEFNPVLHVNQESLYRRLRLKTGTSVFEAVQCIHSSCLEKTAASVRFQALYLLEKNENLIEHPLLDRCEWLLFCFITIGKPVLEEIDESFNNGRYLEGYLINEMANEAVMSAATQLYEHVKKRLGGRGYHLTRRFSPGECQLDLSCNRLMMEKLGKTFTLSAELTDQTMLDPPKSMLFLYGVDFHLPEQIKDVDCSWCQSLKCDYREVLAEVTPDK
jgi:hypothetical protein